MVRQHSQTGEWCFQNGVVCDHHVSNSPFPLKNGEQCMNRFYGLCDKGDRYLPYSNSPEGRQVTVKQCTPNEFLAPYHTLIGQTFDVVDEISDAVYVRIKGRLFPILLRDCIMTYKSDL
jgi:hypothetical protein